MSQFANDRCTSCGDWVEYHFCDSHEGPHCDAQWCGKSDEGGWSRWLSITAN